MAPRRSVKISPAENRVHASSGRQRGRTKKTMPLKVQSSLTISIPQSLNVPDNEKKVDSTTKRALADEVARAQILKQPVEVRLDLKSPKIKGKKNVVSSFFNNNGLDPPIKQRIVRPYSMAPVTRKGRSAAIPLLDEIKIEEPDDNSIVDYSPKTPESIPPPVQPRRRGRQKKVVDPLHNDANDITNESDVNSIVDYSPKTPESIAPPVQPRRTGRKNNIVVPLDNDVNNIANESDVNSIVDYSPKTPESIAPPVQPRRTGRKNNIVVRLDNDVNNIANESDVNSIVDYSPKTPESIPPPIQPRRTGRHNNIVSPLHNDLNNIANESVTKAAPTISKTNYKKVPPKKTPVLNKIVTRKRVADSIVKQPEIKIQKLTTEQIADAIEENLQNETTTNCKEEPENIELFNQPMETPIKRRKILSLKGKKDKVENKVATPILQKQKAAKAIDQINDNVPVLIKSPKPKTQNGKPGIKSACQVDSRKTSTSSTSNLSWTRDISSSSTTTSIIASTSDFVRFNKRLPVIELTNISTLLSSKVGKFRGVAPKDTESEVYSVSESESGVQPLSHKSSMIQFQSNMKDVHLSSSSSSSITVSGDEDSVSNYDLNKKHYRQAADNLAKALKKMDLEFVNWIEETDCVPPDFCRIKDKLFDILKSEMCALSHCRKLQKIFNPYLFEDDHDIDTANVPNGHKKCLVTKTQAAEYNNTLEHKLDCNKNNSLECIKVINNNIIKPNVVKINKSKGNVTEINKFKKNKTETDRKVMESVNNSLESNRSDRFDNSRVEINIPGTKKGKSPIASNQSCTRRENKPKDERPGTSGIKFDTLKESFPSMQVSESDDSSSESTTCTKDVVNSLSRSLPDDDDALSLFAESITGIESSRVNNSATSAPKRNPIEEYVPEPIQKPFVIPPNYTYCPSKITITNITPKAVCEKQNADSTSLNKEINNVPTLFTESSIPDTPQNNKDIFDKSTNLDFNINRPNETEKPRLIEHYFANETRESRLLFHGYCFYNLLRRCHAQKYNLMCRYSHHIPHVNEIKFKLEKLSDDMFIREYMTVRRWYILRRRYGKCFIYECVRRRLTRVLIEMAYDFIVKCYKEAEVDETLKVFAVEMALLHLNTVDLSVCEDLLKLKVDDEIILCEVFMTIMTSTQNFSRFKSVFLNLTYFMVNNDRMFRLDVAEQILERVCILPLEEPIVKGLIQIMRLTNPLVFYNSMITKFESLISEQRDIYEEYLTVKREVNFVQLSAEMVKDIPSRMANEQLPTNLNAVDQEMLLKSVTQPLKVQTMDQPMMARPVIRDGVPMPPSPDTTHLDNMNKTTEYAALPKITRTMWSLNYIPHHSDGVSPCSSKSEDSSNLNYHSWRNRSILHKARFSTPSTGPPLMLMRPPNPPIRPQLQQRLVTLGGNPITYLPGAEYYKPS